MAKIGINIATGSLQKYEISSHDFRFTSARDKFAADLIQDTNARP